MRRSLLVAAIVLASMITAASPAYCITQEAGGYTFIKGETGSQVCVGTWVPPSSVGKPGDCEGELMDVAQFSAVTATQSIDRLDQLVNSLSSIDEKMAASNAQLQRLIDVELDMLTLLDQQSAQSYEQLRAAISSKFDAAPTEFRSYRAAREAIKKLREDIMKEFDKYAGPSPQPTTP